MRATMGRGSSSEEGVGLVVDTITSQRLNLTVGATDTIASLKQRIQQTEVSGVVCCAVPHSRDLLVGPCDLLIWGGPP